MTKIYNKENPNEVYDTWFQASLRVEDLYLDVLEENGYDWQSVDATGINVIVLRNMENGENIIVSEDQFQRDYMFRQH